MRTFNSIQITVLFAIYPFVANWVRTAEFYGHAVLFWVLVVGYVFSFAAMAFAVYHALKEHWND